MPKSKYHNELNLVMILSEIVSDGDTGLTKQVTVINE